MGGRQEGASSDGGDGEGLRAIRDAAYRVGTSLDWVDHGGGDRAWALIHEQPALVRAAYDRLTPRAQELLSAERIERFVQLPVHRWSELHEAARAALEQLGEPDR